MTSLIKQGQSPGQVAVRRIQGVFPNIVDSPEDGRPPARDPAIEALECEVGELREALAAARVSAADAVADAKAAGRDEAMAAYAKDEAVALQRLERGVADALARLDQRIAGLDSLALLLAQAALAKVFENIDDYQEKMSRCIQLQMAGLQQETIVAVRVSPEDFRDEEALTGLGRGLPSRTVNIRPDESLSAGDFKIELQLGHYEFSISRHWAELTELFRKMADEAESA